MKLSRVGASVAMTAIAALALVGCAGGDTATTDANNNNGAADNGASAAPSQDNAAGSGGTLSGQLNATGASSQEQAELNAWVPGFQGVESGVTINYEATGSGTGRENFVAGTSDFIGSDRAFKTEEIEQGGFPLCAEGTDLVEFPAYISPIAVAYNLPGVDGLKLDGETLAKIYKGEITKWNDEAIAAINAGVELPDMNITAVHRADKSGTTGNFTAYLEKAAPEVWTVEKDDNFPEEFGGEGANQTQGVADAVAGGEGTIGYLDASAAKDLQVAAIKSGNDFVEYSPEAAAAVVAGSSLDEGRAPTDLAYKLDYTGVEGAYPIVLVSYLIGCADYQDDAKAELVKAYFSYVITAEAQDAAAEVAGSAPISDEIRTKARTAIDSIQ